METILLVNGPNLNMLGIREVEKYGGENLAGITARLEKKAADEGYKLKSFQSNHEGALVDFIQKEGLTSAGMVLNAGAYTHTSIAVRDAILAVRISFIEVHLTNIYSREEFRHHSWLSDIAAGLIAGFGPAVYDYALTAMVDLIRKKG